MNKKQKLIQAQQYIGKIMELIKDEENLDHRCKDSLMTAYGYIGSLVYKYEYEYEEIDEILKEMEKL
jgi:hypothetical protein